jgi:hypothetical protein
LLSSFKAEHATPKCYSGAVCLSIPWPQPRKSWPSLQKWTNKFFRRRGEIEGPFAGTSRRQSSAA